MFHNANNKLMYVKVLREIITKTIDCFITFFHYTHCWKYCHKIQIEFKEVAQIKKNFIWAVIATLQRVLALLVG